MDTEDAVKETVADYYGKSLRSSADLKTNACCAAGEAPGWLAQSLQNVHPSVLDRFYGCGFPIPPALAGCTVLDLGCGTGRDVFIAAQLVGATGQVIGLDMTDAQLEVARKTEAWHAERFGFDQPNTRFVHGFIEDLRTAHIADDSVDVVISNCVVNLSPRKDQVLAEVYRVLKPGGEFYLSDVVCSRRLPEPVATDPLLYAECLGGALYERDFVALAQQTGFKDPREAARSCIRIGSEDIKARVGKARFSSVTYRLFKLASLDASREDYGDVLRYRGGIAGAESTFLFERGLTFEAGVNTRVCRNTAAMIVASRYTSYFDVVERGSTHLGAFQG